MREVLVEAIRARLLVTIWYPPGSRTIEPHALGFGSQGQLLLRAFQVEGASASGESENWKLFRLDRMEDCSPGSASFVGPRSDYKRNDRAMKGGILAQL